MDMTVDTTDVKPPRKAQKNLFEPEVRERIERIWKPCWIDYAVAREGLTRLERLLIHPRTHRPPCCIVVGDTNNGKTTLARRFQQLYNPEDSGTDEAKRLPIVYVQAPPMADVAGLYTNILKAVGAPYAPSWTAQRKQHAVLTILTSLCTRILMVDELHNIKEGKVDQRGVFLNVLKHLNNELQIPIVGIGTKEALRIIQTDQQLGNRFEPFHLPRWKPDVGYAQFLGSICKHAGLEDVSFVRDKGLVRRIHALSEGLTGETWSVMCKAIERMGETGRKALDTKTLEEIDWIPPGERRRQA
tara:strand:+ start:2690 stop:3592 length:903 start_codon:yes stop_codon:yes gene_type:complete